MEEKEEIIKGLKAQIHRLEVDNQLLRRNEEKINSIMIEFIAITSKQISRHVAWLKEEEDDNKAFLTRIKSTLMRDESDDADEFQVVKVDPSKKKRGTKRRRLINETLSGRRTSNTTNELNNEELETQQYQHNDADNNTNQDEESEEIPHYPHVYRKSKAKAKPPPKGIDIESSIHVKIEPSSSSDNNNTDTEEDEEEKEAPIDDEASSIDVDSEEPEPEAEVDEPMSNNDTDQEEDEKVEEIDEDEQAEENEDAAEEEKAENDDEEEEIQDKNSGSTKTKYIDSGLTFTSRSEALQHLNKQYKTRWIKYRMTTSKKTGTTKIWYYCKYDSSCPVRSLIIVSNLPNKKQQVDLYMSEETAHVHNSSPDQNKYRLTDDQKRYIQNAIDRSHGCCVSFSAIVKDMRIAKLTKSTRSDVLHKYIKFVLFRKRNEKKIFCGIQPL